jgi:hypothetical protein
MAREPGTPSVPPGVVPITGFADDATETFFRTGRVRKDSRGERLRQDGHEVLYIAELSPSMADDDVLEQAKRAKRRSVD